MSRVRLLLIVLVLGVGIAVTIKFSRSDNTRSADGPIILISIDTLRAVPGVPGRFQGTVELPEGFTLSLSSAGYDDFEDDYDLEETGGCGMAATTIVVRMSPQR